MTNPELLVLVAQFAHMTPQERHHAFWQIEELCREPFIVDYFTKPAAYWETKSEETKRGEE